MALTALCQTIQVKHFCQLLTENPGNPSSKDEDIDSAVLASHSTHTDNRIKLKNTDLCDA